MFIIGLRRRKGYKGAHGAHRKAYFQKRSRHAWSNISFRRLEQIFTVLEKEKGKK